MKTLLSIFGILALLISSAANVNAQSLIAVFSAQVEEDEIDGFTPSATPEDPEPATVIDQAFFNVQGDDDAFTVYSLVDFDTSTIGQVSAVTSISLDLGQANAFFSADGGLEFFLAADTRAVELTDTARYIATGSNIGAAVVGDAFGTLYPLGTGTYTETMTGDVDTFTLSLDSDGEAFAISQINSGGLLRIIATPADLGVQATYAGAGTFFDEPTFPTLNLTVSTDTGGPLLGDVNRSGVVDFFDIQPFIDVLSDGSNQPEADIDMNGAVNFFDIAGFIGILSGTP